MYIQDVSVLNHVSKVNMYKEICISCDSVSYGYSIDSPWRGCWICGGDTEGIWMLNPNRQLEFQLDEIW